MNKEDEIMALAVKHNVDGCLSHNIRLIAFANACEKIGMEKAAKMVDHILKEGGGTYGDAIRAATPQP